MKRLVLSLSLALLFMLQGAGMALATRAPYIAPSTQTVSMRANANWTSTWILPTGDYYVYTFEYGDGSSRSGSGYTSFAGAFQHAFYWGGCTYRQKLTVVDQTTWTIFQAYSYTTVVGYGC